MAPRDDRRASHARCLGHEGERFVGGFIDALGLSTELLDVARLAEKIALSLVAKLTRKEIELGDRLYALRQHRQIEGAAEPQHRTHDGGGLLVVIDRLDESA